MSVAEEKKKESVVVLPEGWSVLGLRDFEYVGKIIQYYGPVVPDHVSVLGLMAYLEGCERTFVHPKGFVAVEEYIPGACVTIHGGKWSKEGVTDIFEDILKYIGKEFDVSVVLAEVPQNSPAKRLLDSIGFMETGIRPRARMYGNKPTDMIVYTLFVSALE